MWITAAALGAVLPVLLLHFRCSTPVPGYRSPIAHYPLPIPDVSYIQMHGCSHGSEYFALQELQCLS